MMGRNKKWAYGPLFSPIVLLDVAPIQAGPNKKPRSGAFITKAFTPTNAVDANNKYSYQIVIYGNADYTFVLNDISLVYRDKTLK